MPCSCVWLIVLESVWRHTAYSQTHAAWADVRTYALCTFSCGHAHLRAIAYIESAKVGLQLAR